MPQENTGKFDNKIKLKPLKGNPDKAEVALLATVLEQCGMTSAKAGHVTDKADSKARGELVRKLIAELRG